MCKCVRSERTRATSVQGYLCDAGLLGSFTWLVSVYLAYNGSESRVYGFGLGIVLVCWVLVAFYLPLTGYFWG